MYSGRQGGGGRVPQLGIFLLAYQLFAGIGLNRIPPVTLAAIALQVGIFLRVLGEFLGTWTLWPSSMICLDASAIVHRHEFYRMFTAPLFHGSDIHVYYNMISLAWKGIHLERRYGSIPYAILLAFFTFLTGWIYVGLAVLATRITEDPSYMRQCAVGFSAVLFALKVLVNDSDGDFGFFTVPKKMAIWAELLLIQVLVPNASFIGHLAGILAGIAVAHLLPTLYALLVKEPFEYLRDYPVTFFTSGLLGTLHLNWISKPWPTKVFWSSGTALVCLNARHIVNKQDWWRMISAPLEHASDIHFAICLVSYILKVHRMERRQPFLRLIFVLMTASVSTSIVYVVASQVLSDFTDPLLASECVQGLSGPLFALKVLTFLLDEFRFDFKFAFELAELLILLEKRTLVYHLSGLFVGLLCWTLLCKDSPYQHWRFPGQGQTLGSNGTRRPWTRSWGYAHYEPEYFHRNQRLINESEVEDTSG